MAGLAVTLLAGCQSLGYYGQAIAGHVRVMHARTPVARLVADPTTPPARRARFEHVDEALAFAAAHLALPVHGRYRTFVDWPDSAVVWNVFATDEFSVEPHEWCYPFVGCAGYRGYFRRTAADAEARRWRLRDADARVGGAAAYSTLGWFDDPLLSTFIDWPEPELAGLIFHELAHSRVFVKGDTEFNESYATFVERTAVAEWLAARGDSAVLAAWRERLTAADLRARFMLAWREALARLYRAPYPDYARRMMKVDMMAMAQACEKRIVGTLRLPADINNADFVPWAAYRRSVPAFEALFVASDRDWSRFHAAAAEIGKRDANSRRAAVEALRTRAPERDEALSGCEAIVPIAEDVPR